MVATRHKKNTSGTQGMPFVPVNCFGPQLYFRATGSLKPLLTVNVGLDKSTSY